MAFCSSCGTQAEGKFCPKCGSPLAAAGGGGAAPTPGATPQPASPVQSSGMTDNVAAALCYALTFLTGILFLVLEPYNKNKLIRFHAFQAIFFGVAVVLISIVGSILTSVFYSVPMIGTLFAILFHTLLSLVFLLVWLFLMYKAYNNEKFMLPILGPLAEKQA
jgi:uncharacterized membrane protein